VKLEEAVKKQHVELMHLVLKKEELEAKGILWPFQVPQPPVSEPPPAMTNTNDIPSGSSVNNVEPITTCTVQGLGVLLEKPEHLAVLGKLAVQKAKSSGLLKKSNDLLVHARLIGIDDDDSVKKIKKKSELSEKVFSENGRFWTPSVLKNSYLRRVQELDDRVRREETVFEAAKAALDALNIVNADVLQEDSRDVRRRILTDRERQDF
jgi:hypothetical protein